MIEGFKRDAENLVLFFKRYVYFTNDILLLEIINLSLGDTSDEGTPGNIPNPEVKLVSADGTWGAAPWESRSLPRDFFYLTPKRQFICIYFPSLRAPLGAWQSAFIFYNNLTSVGIFGEAIPSIRRDFINQPGVEKCDKVT